MRRSSVCSTPERRSFSKAGTNSFTRTTASDTIERPHPTISRALHGRDTGSGLLALLTSPASGFALAGAEVTLTRLREVPDRYSGHPAICVPHLADLGDAAALLAAALRPAEGLAR